MITRPRPTRPYTAPFEMPLMKLSQNSFMARSSLLAGLARRLLGLDRRRRDELALSDELAVLDLHPLELRRAEVLVLAVLERRKDARLDGPALLERSADRLARDVPLDRLHDLGESLRGGIRSSRVARG